MKKVLVPVAILIAIIVFSQVFSYYASAALADKFKSTPLKEAMYYEKLEGKKVRCLLCPRRCIIPDRRRGFCRVRENRDGILYTLVYGKPCAVHVDPIEKKPLFHVLPGTKSFSIATAGCNLACKFCQNWQISQASPEEVPYENLPPEGVVRLAKSSGSATIAYTYTEPVVFYEYMLDTAKLVHQTDILNVMHSAGFINEEPLRELARYIDAANIDLKGSDRFYDELCMGTRADVLRALEILKEEGVFVEITCLIIPTLNDDIGYIKETCLWIKEHLGPDTPIHFSRFWPMYKLKNLSPTPMATLEKARDIAMEVGLRYVYIGNIPGHKGETTYCPYCGKILIERIGYNIVEYNIKDGKCKFCKETIAGIFRKK